MIARKLAGWLAFSLMGMVAAQALAADPSAVPPVAEFRNGSWHNITPPAPKPKSPVSDPQLDRMQLLLSQNKPDDAVQVGVNWIHHSSKTAPDYDRMLLLMAYARYQQDDWINSFYYLDELMDEFPDSRFFYTALERQYQIADGFLNGHKLSALGLKVLSADDEGVEMLYRIQQRSPGSTLAEKALLRTADYYFSDGDYALAHDAYGYYIKNYPRSEMVPKVKLRQAFSSLAQFRGIKFDATSILDARAELTDFQAGYPEMSSQENVQAIIDRIDSTLAAKLFYTADFYRRTRAFSGAVYMYRYLIQAYPKSKEADQARKALPGMPKAALDEAPPQLGGRFPGAGT